MFPFDMQIRSISETEDLSRTVALYLLDHFHDSALFLEGELGSGKTAFTRAMGRVLEIQDTINSPTFNLLNEYDGKKAKLFHYDLYRIQAPEEIIEMGFPEIWDEKYDMPAIHVIEWWKKAGIFLPDRIPCFSIQILFNRENEDARQILGKQYH